MGKQTLKSRKFFFIWTAASLLCMIAIFTFSSQNGEKSENLSGSLALSVFDVLHEGIGAAQTDSIIDTLNILVRKAAHFSIYFILGFCASNAVRQVTADTRLIFSFSLLLCSLYAATDELHQNFVPGRACRWQDWLIDTAGVFLGICVMFLVARRIKKSKERKQTANNISFT